MSSIALLVGALVAQAVPPVQPETSLYFRCTVTPRTQAISHKFDIVFFSHPPGGARGYNVRDPDGLLPRNGQPMAANAWPTTLLVTYVDGDQRLAALRLEPLESSPGRAAVRIDWHSASSNAPRRYVGECTYTAGEIAEREFLELLK